jgi:hypothetical protein
MESTISKGQGWIIIGLLGVLLYGLYYGATQAEAALSGPTGIIGSVGSAITGLLAAAGQPSTEPIGQPAAYSPPGAAPII